MISLIQKTILEKSLLPEFKKNLIYTRALELTVEKGNISFKTAIKKAIVEFNDEEKFIKTIIKDFSEDSNEYISIINSLIDFYIENEVSFIAEILKFIAS